MEDSTNSASGPLHTWDVRARLAAADLRQRQAAEACDAHPAEAERRRGASQAEAAPLRLESRHSKVNSAPFSGAVVVPCMCRARTCKRCGPRMGWIVRQNLLVKAADFQRPAMLTLTVDRSHFDSPQAAHEAITRGKFIPRFLRLLGVRHWVWVLEFQMKTGDGWPHWHCLIDLADAPGGRIDLERAWHLWRDKWKLGGLDLKVKQFGMDTGHAVMYVTKYLTKMPPAFPEWVLKSERGIRFIGGCKALGSLTGQPVGKSCDEEAIQEPVQLKLFREPRNCFVHRMARCGLMSHIFCLVGDCESKSGVWSFLRRVKATAEDLYELGSQGAISARLAPITWGDSELWAVLETSKCGAGVAVHALERELEDREVGYSEAWAARVAERERSILEDNREAWKTRGKAAAGNEGRAS